MGKQIGNRKSTIGNVLNVKVVFILVVLLLSPRLATAHEGPPFPIIVDQQVGPCVLSVWTDPDVGDSAFFVIVGPPAGGTLPDDLKIQLGITPVSGRLQEVVYDTIRGTLRGQVQYETTVKFDAQEMWRVRVIVASAAGTGEAAAEVEATPPGYGRWDLLIYLAPFVAVGFLWVRAMLRRRAAKA